MEIISQKEAFITLATFAIAMIGLVWLLTKKQMQSNEHFLLANRNVSWVKGAFSIAVSWMWAPAIFIVSLQAYTQGLAGAFWFIIPNIICFFVFAPVAIRLRKLMPEGFTLPEFIIKKYNGDIKTHLSFLTIFFGYQLGAIIINCVAGGTLLSILTGMDFNLAVLAISGVALTYSLKSGLEASVLTDLIQMLMIITLAFILVPWVITSSGGVETIKAGLGGVTGEFSNMLHPGVAFAFGIPMTLSLISGPIGDQMFFQRGFAVNFKHIVKVFVMGGLLFAIVPIMLSLLGFIAASPEFSQLINVTDPQMVGPITIGYFLPKGALILFLCMAFAGLCSTLDSAYCAISSLGTIDIYKRYFNKEANDQKLIKVARNYMLICAVIGTGIALLQPKLLWIFLINGALASAGFFPTIFSIFSKRLSKNSAFLAVTLSLLFGLPLSIYANVQEDTKLIVLSSILSVVIGLGICAGSIIKNKLTTIHTS